MIQVDDSGCVTIPGGAREELGITPDDCLKMWIEDNTIILQKVEPCCVFCERIASAVEFKGKLICVQCIHELQFFYGME